MISRSLLVAAAAVIAVSAAVIVESIYRSPLSRIRTESEKEWLQKCLYFHGQQTCEYNATWMAQQGIFK